MRWTTHGRRISKRIRRRLKIVRRCASQMDLHVTSLFPAPRTIFCYVELRCNVPRIISHRLGAGTLLTLISAHGHERITKGGCFTQWGRLHRGTYCADVLRVRRWRIAPDYMSSNGKQISNALASCCHCQPLNFSSAAYTSTSVFVLSCHPAQVHSRSDREKRPSSAGPRSQQASKFENTIEMAEKSLKYTEARYGSHELQRVGIWEFPEGQRNEQASDFWVM